uniref:Uncharacterized protein n=1 Tax=Lactuca sativa TaxID=4236 RepID=A0A9R1URZ7_LACSA|nr:hypothetical protein LSAT_V11C800422220 [Lactuca sativa]
MLYFSCLSGSQISEPGTSKIESMSPAQAQQHLSLFFALCTKKPSRLQLVFDKYHHARKAVKQALGPSYSDLLSIISDPPQGSENLLTQVLNILCEGTTPSADLISTVKRLYETILKDVAIPIPILSSFTKNEVLPIFPSLVFSFHWTSFRQHWPTDCRFQFFVVPH